MEHKQKALDLQKKPFLSFGWAPDYENIGIYYQRAAGVFANTDVTEAITCYECATENLIKAGIIFEAAKCQELLAKLLKRSSKLPESVIAFDKAGDLYRKLAQNDTASDMFSNAAQAAESANDITGAGSFYTKAVDVLVDNDKGLLSHDIFKKSTGFFLKNKLYKKAIELYKKQVLVLASYKKPGIPKVQLSIVIIYLAINEAENATNYMNECISNLGGSSASIALLGGGNIELPTELSAAQLIIEDVISGNHKSVEKNIRDIVMFLDVEVAKLSNTISANIPQVPHAMNAPSPINIQEINEEEGFS
eukprot:NODE_232_length_13679_cov_0.197349.p7 type:complete len:307 gc:universal NODE_232_length_13679_cov_0.197349:13373-12453(-)